MEILDTLKLLGALYAVSIGLIYLFSKRAGAPLVMPGDIFVRRGQRRIYVPVASAFLLTIILYLFVKSVLPKQASKFKITK